MCPVGALSRMRGSVDPMDEPVVNSDASSGTTLSARDTGRDANWNHLLLSEASRGTAVGSRDD
jgi:hypothetical protein